LKLKEKKAVHCSGIIFNPEFALGIPEIIGGRVKRVKK
jgi:hypothetical protein